jgi:DegV family protein with EDD domain
MARIRVVTDSASDLPEDVASRLDIDVVSLTIRFGDEEFTDRVDLTPEVFWAKCKTSKTLPETSAPSVGAFQAAYERAAADGCDAVLVVTLSSLLSATYQSASLAADAVGERIAVRVIDTENVSMGQGLIAIDLAELAATGATLEELSARATALLPKSGVLGTIDTLEHLIKGGRIGGAKALIGQVLSIKPLVELKGGVVAEAGRQRTRAKALAAVARATATHAPLRRLALVHGACSDADVATLRGLANEIASEFPLIVTDIGPVVGTHAGPGIIALTFVES